MPGRRLQRREECPSRRLRRPLCRHYSIPDDRQADPEGSLRMLGRRPPGQRTRGRRLREPTQKRWTVKRDLCLSQRFHWRRGVHGSKTWSGTLGPSKAERTGREDQASRTTEGPGTLPVSRTVASKILAYGIENGSVLKLTSMPKL